MQVFQRRWFRNKVCMDIGCNEGLITLGLASRFGTASMLGIDIDEVLIRKACRCAEDLIPELPFDLLQSSDVDAVHN